MTAWGSFNKVVLKDVLSQLGFKESDRNKIEAPSGHVEQRNPKDLTVPIWITLSADFFIGIPRFVQKMTSYIVDLYFKALFNYNNVTFKYEIFMIALT